MIWLASDSPSSVRWAPPADSSGGRQPNQKCPLLGSGAPRLWCVTALCGWWYLAWVWVGGRRIRRPPQLSLSFHVYRLFSGKMATAFLLNSLSPTAFVDTLPRRSFLGARLSLPPPPLPFSPYNRMCPTTLPTNGRVVSWAFSHPHPAGPGLPVGFRCRSPSLSSPPPPPYSMALIVRVR